MKGKTVKLPEDVENIDDFYRKMDKAKRIELLQEYLTTARYMKNKSDMLFEHVAVMACVTAEESAAEREKR